MIYAANIIILHQSRGINHHFLHQSGGINRYFLHQSGGINHTFVHQSGGINHFKMHQYRAKVKKIALRNRKMINSNLHSINF